MEAMLAWLVAHDDTGLPVELNNGRVTIPAAFPQSLGALKSVWITNLLINKERCLLLYTPDEWQRYDAKLQGQSDKERLLLRAFMIGGGAVLPIDRHWQVQIPLLLLLKFINGTALSATLPPGEPHTVLLCRPDPRWML